jgi:type IV secretory pathway TrbD component
MYGNWVANLAVVGATIVAVTLAVLAHYEGLVQMSRLLARGSGDRRIKVLYGIASVILLHVVEIWIFGVTVWLLLAFPACGSIGGAGAEHLLDFIYLSAVTFTTVGYGDLLPVGPIRFLYGTEALAGFVLITWSASFTFLEMERYWRGAR